MFAMSAILQFTVDEEAKALPILLRHSPGTVLPNRTYIVDESVVGVLREAGIEFHEITPTLDLPYVRGTPIGERV